MPETKLTSFTGTNLPSELLQDKHCYWTSRQQACQAALFEQAKQPLTKEQWQILQVTLEELELASWEVAQTQEAITTEDELSSLLADWFDRLQQMPVTPDIAQPPATLRKTEVKSSTTPLVPPSSTPDTSISTPPIPVTTGPDSTTSTPTPRLHLEKWLESPTPSRRLKQYINSLLKTVPTDDSNIPKQMVKLVNRYYCCFAATHNSPRVNTPRSKSASKLIQNNFTISIQTI